MSTSLPEFSEIEEPFVEVVALDDVYYVTSILRSPSSVVFVPFGIIESVYRSLRSGDRSEWASSRSEVRAEH